jgi:hypothetical protein
MAISFQDYTATADQVANGFSFSFPYLSDNVGNALLNVYVQGSLLSSSNYTITTSPQKIVISSGYVSVGNAVKIARDSSTVEHLVDFTDGSVLTESDLDRGYRHGFYLSQEAAEGSGGELLGKKGGDNYDAEGNKIINLGTPTASTDAVTKAYVDDQDFADRAYIDALGLDHFDGSNLSANVDMNGNRFINVADPIGIRDVVNKQYVTGVADQLTVGTGASPSYSTFTQSGTDTDFTLTFTPNHSDSQSYLVTVNGSVQSPSDYTIVGGLNVLRFNSAPALSASIVIVERGYRYAYSYISNTLDYGSVAVAGADDFVDYGGIL